MSDDEVAGHEDEMRDDETPQAEPVLEEPEEEEPQLEERVVEPTGHAGVDEILSGLERLDGLEVHEHVAEFEGAHQALRRALDSGGQ